MSTVAVFTGPFLALFYTFVAVFYVVVINKHKRQNNTVQYVHMGDRYSFHWWNHLTFRVFRMIIWMVCVLRLIWPEVDQWIGLYSWPHFGPYIIGITLLMGGFGLAITTHFQMRDDWRSGIDAAQSGHLITQGLYAYSRNPAYIGVASAQLGFLMALPSVFSLICFFVGISALYFQVLLEEQYLTSKYGKQYQLYSRSVPRWL